MTKVFRCCVVFFAFCCFGAGGLREDEFDCEEAAAHLADCCPAFDAQKLNCEFAHGCESPDQHPGLSLAETRCIEAKSCSELVSSGVCERTKTRMPDVTLPAPSFVEVCR
jgi:hypothetical protein